MIFRLEVQIFYLSTFLSLHNKPCTASCHNYLASTFMPLHTQHHFSQHLFLPHCLSPLTTISFLRTQWPTGGEPLPYRALYFISYLPAKCCNLGFTWIFAVVDSNFLNTVYVLKINIKEQMKTSFVFSPFSYTFVGGIVIELFLYLKKKSYMLGCEIKYNKNPNHWPLWLLVPPETL